LVDGLDAFTAPLLGGIANYPGMIGDYPLWLAPRRGTVVALESQ